MKINPYFYEDSLRLRAYNIEGKIFLKLLRQFVNIVKTYSQPRPGVKTLTREQNKQTNNSPVSKRTKQTKREKFIVINM